MNTIVEVKLGSNSRTGFYHESNKEYTQIQKGRMPHQVLQILVDLEKEFPGNVSGFCGKNFISRRLMRTEIGEELKFDSKGYQVSLDSLLKDFKKGKLVTGYVGQSNYASVKITPLGKLFLANNTVEIKGQ